MIYLNKFTLPSELAEINVIKNESRTCFNTFYPFKIFSDKGLERVSFENVTLLYGGNGSGKSTLINVIAEKLKAFRNSDFNSAPLFNKYVEMCAADFITVPRTSCVLTSDDVFDYVLNARSVNENIDDKRNELFHKYIDVKREAQRDPDIGRLKGLDNYERWSETREILSKNRSQSSYIKKRIAKDIELHSNGETAMRYFLEQIDEDALYLLDEPENSLSIEFQIDLAEYIAMTARSTRSQFIIATHSPVFLSMKNAKIYNLDTYPVSVCRWTELPNVRRYFEFFMDRQDEFL